MTKNDKMSAMLDRAQQDAARAHVIAERTRRGLSAREAARVGGITNTVWSKFEGGGNVTPGVRNAVANAFGWPYSWPERLPELTPEPAAQRDEITQRLARIEELVELLRLGQETGLAGLDQLLQQVLHRLPEPDATQQPSQQVAQ